MNKPATSEWLQNNGDGSGTAGSGLTEPPSEMDVEKKENKSFFACFSCGCIFLGLISLVFCGFFVYCAVVQDNHHIDDVEWTIYYSFNALVPAVFLVYYTCLFPVMVLHLLSFLTAVWSIVYIVFALAFLPSGGATEGTGNNDNQTLLEEWIFELAGASIGLFSSLYHPFMAKCCVSKDDKKLEEENADEINLSEQV